jgi:hypothetical protein
VMVNLADISKGRRFSYRVITVKIKEQVEYTEPKFKGMHALCLELSTDPSICALPLSLSARVTQQISETHGCVE